MERLALAGEDVIEAKTYGRGNPVRFLVFHETANPRVGANADAHARLQASGNVRNASWHVQGDDREVVRSFESDVRCWQDRKSTRLNSSHVAISYAVFCLKKKNKQTKSLA